MKTLLAFSGGMDSIYLLWKELRETDHDITAVFYTGEQIDDNMRKHFHVINLEGKQFADMRWAQIQKIAKSIEDETRQFKIIRKSVDPILLDKENTLFNHAAALRTAMAVRCLNNYTHDRFVAGSSIENDGYIINKNGFVANDSASSLMMKYFIKNAKRGELCLPFCDRKYTVAEAIKESPDWLVSMNRSCQAVLPANSNACNNCYKCMTHEYARNLLKEGKSLDEIYNIYMKKSIMPDGRWRSQKVWIAEVVPCNVVPTVNTMQMPQWGHSVKIGE
jgi:7-cyano-7-deazaguanine synthase in queuosine biosynthesis